MADAILPRPKAGKSFYVYLHRRASDGTVFYVGKGQGNRATRTDSRNQYWRNIVAKHGFVVEYVLRDIQEWYAMEVEREQIALYGRSNLCNLTDGGEGGAGLVVSEATRAKKAAIQRGRKHAPEVKKKISEALKLRESLTGGKRKPLSAEHRAKLSQVAKGRRGIPLSAEARLNMSAAAKKRSTSAAGRQRMSEIAKKAVRTPEQRRLLSELMTARRAKQRAERAKTGAEHAPAVL